VGSHPPLKRPNRQPIALHFGRWVAVRAGRLTVVMSCPRSTPTRLAALLLAGAAAGAAAAQPLAPTLDAVAGPEAVQTAAWTARVELLATQAAKSAFGGRPGVRVEVSAGALDPRLKLAPCAQVDVYLPPGQRAWGRTRVGLRCLNGAVAWNVYMPLTVRVFAPALVATQSLAAGTVLEPGHLQAGEADWAAADSPIVRAADLALGRALLHALPAGAALRDGDLKRRQWFTIGEPVRITATGRGFTVGGEGVALTPGLEGQPVRVRTEGGRTVTGVATGEHRVEISL